MLVKLPKILRLRQNRPALYIAPRNRETCQVLDVIEGVAYSPKVYNQMMIILATVQLKGKLQLWCSPAEVGAAAVRLLSVKRQER